MAILGFDSKSVVYRSQEGYTRTRGLKVLGWSNMYALFLFKYIPIRPMRCILLNNFSIFLQALLGIPERSSVSHQGGGPGSSSHSIL